jgi:hypothetical protein
MKRAGFSLLLLLILGQVVPAQTLQLAGRERIVSYLQSYLAEFNQRPFSLQNEFNGEFVPLSEELVRSLQVNFPKHRFTIARTYYSHYARNEYSANILIITDSSSGEVVGHQWDIGFSGASESFYQFLSAYPAASREDALNKVKALSSLIVATGKKNDRVGKVELEGQKITVEFLSWERPWRNLKVDIGQDMRFSRITMINPILKEVVN